MYLINYHIGSALESAHFVFLQKYFVVYSTSPKSRLLSFLTFWVEHFSKRNVRSHHFSKSQNFLNCVIAVWQIGESCSIRVVILVHKICMYMYSVQLYTYFTISANKTV